MYCPEDTQRDSIYYTMYQLIHNADSTACTHHYESPRLHRNQATTCITQINLDNNTQFPNGDFLLLSNNSNTIRDNIHPCFLSFFILITRNIVFYNFLEAYAFKYRHRAGELNIFNLMNLPRLSQTKTMFLAPIGLFELYQNPEMATHRTYDPNIKMG